MEHFITRQLNYCRKDANYAEKNKLQKNSFSFPENDIVTYLKNI